MTATDIQKRICNLLNDIIRPLLGHETNNAMEAEKVWAQHLFLQSHLLKPGRNFTAMNRRIIMAFVNFKPKELIKEAEEWLERDNDF